MDKVGKRPGQMHRELNQRTLPTQGMRLKRCTPPEVERKSRI